MGYKITLQTPDGTEEFEGDEDVYILEAAEENSIDLPYSCRSGGCSTCAGLLVSGEVDQEGQQFMSDEQIRANIVLLCFASVRSDCVIKTHQEDLLYWTATKAKRNGEKNPILWK